MLSYFLIGLCLVLVGIAGLQFAYMFYLDRIHRERRKHINTLEKKCVHLTQRAERAEARIAELQQFIPARKQGEVWAEIIEDR